MLMAPPSTGKDFWIKQPYYSANLKIQDLKTAHGEKCYSGSQANIVESGKKALTPIILLTSGTGSLVVCGKETLKKKKKRKQKLFSLPHIPEKTGKQLFAILPSTRFYSKMHISQQQARMHFQSQLLAWMQSCKNCTNKLSCQVLMFLWPCSKAQ